MTLTSGTPLGSYVILAPLGSGGMGEVYKARDTRLNRLVAIKVLAPAMNQDPSALARFEREARILAGLNHPNIVAIHDVGSDGASPYVVTELLEGETLAALLKKGALPSTRAIGLTLQIVDGLVAAHARGVVHRDLKPSNVFIGRDGQVKILDFGLAKDLHLDMESTMSGALPVPGMTLKGTVMGTVGYMSPEQVRGEAADIRSDLFTLGVLLLEMLTGRQAFTGDSAVEVLHAILRSDPLEGEVVPPELHPVLQRLLAKDPEDRFQTAKDLRYSLANPASGSSRPRIQDRAPWRSHWRGALASALLFGLGAAGVALGVRIMARPKPLPQWTVLTPAPGLISAGRFSPDGRTVLFSMAGQDGLNRISSLSEGDAFPHPTGRSGKVLALGPGNEIFHSEPGEYAVNHGGYSWGDLLHSSGPQTEPRVLAEDVHDADLHPNGKDLVVIRGPGANAGADATSTLEAPVGNVLVRIGEWANCPRWSRDGRSVAFIERKDSSWAGQIVVVDMAGKVSFRSPYLRSIRGLSWAPDGHSLLFGHSPKAGILPGIFAMDLKGHLRELLTAPVELVILDVDQRGRLLVLAGTDSFRLRLEEQGRISTAELPMGLVRGFPPIISPDGQKVALQVREADLSYCTYIRNRSDGGLVRILPNASPIAFSNDNRWLLVQKFDWAQNRVQTFALIPLGPGAERLLNSEGLGEAQWGTLPDVENPVVITYTPGGTGFVLFRLQREGPPIRVAATLNNPQNLIQTGQDSYLVFDREKGLFQGSLSRNQWVPVSGPLAKFIPLARDPKTGELLVTPAGPLMPWAVPRPMGELRLYRASAGGSSIRPDRGLDLRGMGVPFMELSFSATSVAIRYKEPQDRVMIVDAVLPEFRK